MLLGGSLPLETIQESEIEGPRWLFARERRVRRFGCANTGYGGSVFVREQERKNRGEMDVHESCMC